MTRRILAMMLTGLAACGGGDSGDDDDDRTEITLPGDALYPEGLAVQADGAFLVGSFVEGTILRVPPGAEAGEPRVREAHADTVG